MAYIDLGLVRGQGVPTGGTAGQVLAKKTGTDYDTEWVDGGGGGGGVPAWAHSTAYVAGQAVTQSNVVYFCKTAHTSGASWDATEQAYWSASDNSVKKTGETSQTVEGSLTVGDLYVGGTRVEVVSAIPSSPIADTLYFVTGS